MHYASTLNRLINQVTIKIKAKCELFSRKCNINESVNKGEFIYKDIIP